MQAETGNDPAPDDPEQDRTEQDRTEQDRAEQDQAKAAPADPGADGISADEADRSVPEKQIQRWKDEGGAWLRPD